jgi:hypothetical protein
MMDILRIILKKNSKNIELDVSFADLLLKATAINLFSIFHASSGKFIEMQMARSYISLVRRHQR